MTDKKPFTLRARWVVPVDRPPIDGGTVIIAGHRIVAVGNATDGQVHNLGDVALLPGLVNAHTHLEFSLFNRPLGQPGISFPEWIEQLIAQRRKTAKSLMVETDGFARQRRRYANAGLGELQAAGVVAAGEIASADWPRESFPVSTIQLVMFLEVLGLDPTKRESLLTTVRSFVDELRDTLTLVRPGISPHAPYTVAPDLLAELCKLSATERLPVAMHLAESREELELLQSHAGPLVDVLKSLNAWHPEVLPAGLRPLDYLRQLATAHRALVIHGNYLQHDEIEFLAAHQERMSVVYCPRTHAYFGHEAYPLRELLDAGARVAVGTDSRASNPDLKLLEELRHIARHYPQVSPEAILRMGTFAAAEALGLSGELGSITPGKRAALTMVRLRPDVSDPVAAILQGSADAAAAPSTPSPSK